MGYQRRKGPIDYKGYGQKKKPGLKTRISKTGVLLIIFAGSVLFWLVAPDKEKQEENVSVSGIASFQYRKNIYDRSLNPLAVSFDLYAVYVKPLEVEDSLQTGETLAAILKLDSDQLIKRLRTERSFIWLGHQVTHDKVTELSKLNIAGLYFQKSPVRFYPHNKTAAQVLGYVKDEQGLSGIELFYDKELRGRAFGGLGVGTAKKTFNEGKHIVLTLDLTTQTILEKQMALLLDKTHAGSVAAMAVDSATGEILASVQLPSFDPNTFWDASHQNQKMKMVSMPMNPGGITGIFRYGAAIHAGSSIRMRQAESSPLAVLKPRLQKSGGRARAGYWWPWPGGGYISNELTELPDPTITEKELLAFQQDLGIGCADQVDVPVKGEGILTGGECGEGRLNGVSILGGFSRLVNGGKPVALHFLKGTVDSAGNFDSYHFKAPGRDISNVSAMLSRSFAVSAGDNARFFAAEYLFPLDRKDDFVVEGQEGDTTSEVFKRGQLFNGMLVAASPVENPGMVLFVSVQDGEFDLKTASPMRRFGDAFLRLAAKEMENSTMTESASYVLPSVDLLLADWLKRQEEKNEVQVMKTARVGLIPNVIGMSLRKALLELMPCKVEIEIEGAGRVVAQVPESGRDCGEKILLRLDSSSVEQTQ